MYEEEDSEEVDLDMKVIDELKMSKMKKDMQKLENEKENIMRDIKGLELRKKHTNKLSFHK